MTKFCQPLIPDMDNVKSLLEDSFESGRLSNDGPLNQRLAKEIALFLEIDLEKYDITMTSSGHVALMAAYACTSTKALSIPSYTFESTRCAATLQGIKCNIYDIDNTTGTYHTKDLEIITEENDAICIVTPLSLIPDLEQVYSICQKKEKLLILDGAPSFGTLGIHKYTDIYCLSFHATKTLSIGEGGCIISRKNLGLQSKIKSFLNFGFDSNRKNVMIGMNGKFSEYHAAIGLDLMNKVEEEIKAKLRIADYYRKEIGHLSLPTHHPKTVYQSFPIFTIDERRSEGIRRVLAENQIESNRYYTPLDSLSTRTLYDSNITLPCHSGILDHTLELICNIIKDYPQ